MFFATGMPIQNVLPHRKIQFFPLLVCQKPRLIISPDPQFFRRQRYRHQAFWLPGQKKRPHCGRHTCPKKSGILLFSVIFQIQYRLSNDASVRKYADPGGKFPPDALTLRTILLPFIMQWFPAAHAAGVFDPLQLSKALPAYTCGF